MKRVIACMLVFCMLFSFTACGGDGQQDGEETYELKMALMNVESDPAGESGARIAEKVKERTNGNVVITPYYNSSLGDYNAVMTEVQMGTIDISYQSFSTEIDPTMNITNVPYSATDWEQVKELWAPGSYPYEFLSDRFEALGIKLLCPIYYGFMGIGGSNLGEWSDILDPTVKQECLVRVPVMESYVKLGHEMGFRTTTLPWGDLYSALQTGIADGCIGASASNVWLSFGDVIKQYIDMNYVMEIGVGVINMDKLNSMPEEYQQVILDVFEEERLLQAEAREEWDKNAVEEMGAAGIDTYTPTAEELEPMAKHIREACWPYYSDLIGEDVLDNYLVAVEDLSK